MSVVGETRERVTVFVSESPIETSLVDGFARESDGAVVSFVGVVRDETGEKKVSELEYEAYDEMAEMEMRRIAAEACDRWTIGRVLIAHRTGKLQVGEVSVVIAVSAPHRAEAFEACRFCIETLKQTVPIWKKEVFSDGTSDWVNHP
jgi:molybdopterin synthase catalytic subunit